MSFRSNALNRSLAVERVLAPGRMSSRSHTLLVDYSLAAIIIERVLAPECMIFLPGFAGALGAVSDYLFRCSVERDADAANGTHTKNAWNRIGQFLVWI